MSSRENSNPPFHLARPHPSTGSFLTVLQKRGEGRKLQKIDVRYKSSITK